MKKIFYYILFISIFACQSKQKTIKILDRSTYKSILKEIILVNSVSQQLQKKDSLINKKLMSLVYNKYNIDSLMLKKTIDYYSKEPETLEEIYKEIKKELEDQKDSIQKQIASPKVKIKTDSLNFSKNILKVHH